MHLSDAKELNGIILRAVNALPDSSHELLVDNFHHPYAKFEDPFEWPGITLNGIQTHEARKIINVLLRKVPNFVKGCHVLPESRPKKDTNHLQFVRHIRRKEGEYIYIFRVLAEYMGGADKGEIIEPSSQGLTPSIKTDRIYFTALLLPVRNVTYEKGQIVDFHPLTIKEAYFKVDSASSEGGHEQTIFGTSMVFDDVDFSNVNTRFKELFSFGQTWKPGRLFPPLLVEYLTLCINIVPPHSEMIEGLIPFFDRGFREFMKTGELAGLSESDRNFWERYFQAWEYERVQSRSGNPHWKLVNFPGGDWLEEINKESN